MKLIIISENKLKIMMNGDEMKQYGLDENEFYCSMTNTRKILDNILSSSQVHTGFEVHKDGERILLQLYAQRDGGCELFVTKLPIEEDYISKEENSMPVFSDDERLLPTAKQNKSENRRITLAYRFENLENVREACLSLSARGFAGESELHLSDEGKYYLFVSFESGSKKKSSPSSYLSEFGELENSEISSMYVGEYGSCLYRENAVSRVCE